jgi:hypothetical protein
VEVANPDDMRRVKAAKRVELALEPLAAAGVAEHDRVEPLERHLVAGLGVERAPDLGRSAGSRRRDQPVAVEEDGFSHAPRMPPAAGRCRRPGTNARCTWATVV